MSPSAAISMWVGSNPDRVRRRFTRRVLPAGADRCVALGGRILRPHHRTVRRVECHDLIDVLCSALPCSIPHRAPGSPLPRSHASCDIVMSPLSAFRSGRRCGMSPGSAPRRSARSWAASFKSLVSWPSVNQSWTGSSTRERFSLVAAAGQQARKRGRGAQFPRFGRLGRAPLRWPRAGSPRLVGMAAQDRYPALQAQHSRRSATAPRRPRSGRRSPRSALQAPSMSPVSASAFGLASALRYQIQIRCPVCINRSMP